MKFISVEREQSDLASLMEEAQHDRIVVEQNGQPIGIILSLEDYYGTLDGADTEEISELFNSAELNLKLQRAEAAYTAGEVLSHEDVGRRLQARTDADS